MKKMLTAKFVEAVQPTTKRQEFTDTISPNLILVVQPTGTKSWAWRGMLGGKFKKLTLGNYPSHDLQAARAWANDITTHRDIGIDIQQQRKDEEEAARKEREQNTRTCDWLFDLYMEEEGSKRQSAAEKRRIYNHDIKPAIGHRLADEIEHDDLAKLLRDKAKTAPTQSNAMQSLIRRWFRWSVTIGRDISGMTKDPAADLVKLKTPAKRKRFLNDYEIGLFFRASAASSSRMIEPLMLILHTGVRRAEAFEAPWDEFDLHKGSWIIPEERAKNGMELVVPLPAEMVTMLKERQKITGNHRLVWPSYMSGDEENVAMSGFSKIVADLHSRMEKFAKADGRKVAKWSIHDLRRTVSSGMNALHDAADLPRIPAHIVERVLNHKIGGVAGVYNRYEYFAEKKAALRIWADHLRQIKRLSEKASA